MVEAKRAPPAHILVFEPRVEGHHLGYLRVICEELLAAGYRLTVAVDTRPDFIAMIRAGMAEVLDRAAVVAAYEPELRRPDKLHRIAALLAQTEADLVFLPNLDEIGSAMLRRAAFGVMPPALLHGRMGGIYFRPRFLGSLRFSPNLWLKARGFNRLLRAGWFSHLLLPDPYLHAALKAREPQALTFFLPDFFPADFTADRAAARRQFDLPADRRVFLFYGAGYRRKGLRLAAQAMLAVSEGTPAFLLCAGCHVADRKVAQALDQLTKQGRARVINRYVSDEEEKLLFAASDVALLPYRKHYGSSGVLVRAIGAGLPIIASDEQLIGQLVREHGLGILFRPGDVRALRDAIERAAQASDQEMTRWQLAARVAAPNWTRRAFSNALLGAFDGALRAPNHRSADGAP